MRNLKQICWPGAGGDLSKEKKRLPLIWLGTNTCDGDSISFLNSADPNFMEIVTVLFDFRYLHFVMAAQGDMSTSVLDDTLAQDPGNFILVVEGTVPTRNNGLYCVIGTRGGKPLTALEAVQEFGAAARCVVAAGTCAAFGGPYAAHPNPSESKPVSEVLDRAVINVPGCPVHPAWIAGTLIHLAWYGEPELDDFHRPLIFYGETIHNMCQRRHYFDSGIFAAQPGDPWCTYRIGCKGPVTFADCPSRQWNSEHVSWPVKAGTPCIGCVNPGFPERDMPFFKHLPDVNLPGVTVNANRIGAIAATVTALGIGGHFTAGVLKGRMSKKIRKALHPPGTGFELLETTPAAELLSRIRKALLDKTKE
ncbi:hydrogenase small subunit [Desulfotruncus alcoholivorax]|uniref:hydrogenase small subunit n=1 Tax=Desulfotruncus alcoholivorax TaxID=265477 RepID=UPI0006889712|nr:hydrogenase small subunit [Desulfotruncus alcoholivorax]